MATYSLYNNSNGNVVFKDIYDEEIVLRPQTGGTFDISTNTAIDLGTKIRVTNLGGGGGGGTETDPTVTALLYDINGASLGFSGKGSAATVVVPGNLGTVFDISSLEPAKVSIKTFTSSNRGLVPSSSGTESTKYLKGDGTWDIPTATATMMTGANGITAGTSGSVPAPAATDNIKFLRGDGSWATVTATVAVMTGSNGVTAGTSGAVPAPAATDNTKFLRGDGTWQTATYANFGGATVASPGSAGIVPAPVAGQNNSYLKGDGTWAAVPTVNNSASFEFTRVSYSDTGSITYVSG